MNAISVIAPYKYLGMWVFDDEKVGLVQEPFVGGADQILDRVVNGIPNAEAGFILLFSSTPFPGHQSRLSWQRSDGNGNYYYAHAHGMEGWLCPALLKYFAEPPTEIYFQVKPKPSGNRVKAQDVLVRCGRKVPIASTGSLMRKHRLPLIPNHASRCVRRCSSPKSMQSPSPLLEGVRSMLFQRKLGI